MPFQAVPATVQIRLEGRMDNQQIINDLYFRKISGTIELLDMQALTGSIVGWWGTDLLPLLSENYSTVRAQCIDLRTQDGLVFELPFSDVGGVASESAPNNVAACVSIRSGTQGRSARGRNFVAGIPNSVITLNTLDAGFITSLVAAYNANVGPDNLEPGWQWVIVSRRALGVLRPTGVTFFVTSATMVGNVVRSMRSREVGHGR